MSNRTLVMCCGEKLDMTHGATCPTCGAHYHLAPLAELASRMGISMGGQCHSCGKWHSETWTADDGRVFCYRCGGER
jgi:hypothetical protein